MGSFRMLLLVGSIAGTMIGGSYGLMRFEQAANRVLVTYDVERLDGPEPTVTASPPQTPSQEPVDVESPEELPELPSLRELDLAAITTANSTHTPIEDGFRLGPLTFEPLTETQTCTEATASSDISCASDTSASAVNDSNVGDSIEANETPTNAAQRQTRRRLPQRPRPPPAPRLHSNPGMHTILVARGMMARNETVRGSCYRYLTEVFDRAGHNGWRNRRIVYRAEREGPYANLDLVRPGDWLYIVNDPGRTPVGTHSVMFVGWQDRARGYARVISHGGGGSTSAGRERGYDISETYRIIRPIIRR